MGRAREGIRAFLECLHALCPFEVERVKAFERFWNFLSLPMIVGVFVSFGTNHALLAQLFAIPAYVTIIGQALFCGCPLKKLEMNLRRRAARGARKANAA